MAKRKNKPPQKKSNPKATLQKKAPQQLIRAEYSGPLPHPSILKSYDDIQLGFADRIIKMAENEASHRQKMENSVLEADVESMKKEFAERRIGQACGLIIGLAALGAGAYTAVNGHPITGGFMGTGGVVALVSAFIYGRVSESRQENNTER